MKIKRTKGKKYLHMVQGLASLIDSLTRLCSLGYLWSNLEYKVVMYKLKNGL